MIFVHGMDDSRVKLVFVNFTCKHKKDWVILLIPVWNVFITVSNN